MVDSIDRETSPPLIKIASAFDKFHIWNHNATYIQEGKKEAQKRHKREVKQRGEKRTKRGEMVHTGTNRPLYNDNREPQGA